MNQFQKKIGSLFFNWAVFQEIQGLLIKMQEVFQISYSLRKLSSDELYMPDMIESY